MNPKLRISDPLLRRCFALTGGIACGKSTVAEYFRELGAYTIDADQVGHDLLLPGQQTAQLILGEFGNEILGPSGQVDRKKLGAVVFADPARRRALEAILHPRIMASVAEMAGEQFSRSPESVVIAEAALIYEAGFDTDFGKLIVAWCRPEQQLERLAAKPGFSREEAERRIRSQMPAEEKRRRADYVIDCSGSLESSQAQARSTYLELKRLAAQASCF